MTHNDEPRFFIGQDYSLEERGLGKRPLDVVSQDYVAALLLSGAGSLEIKRVKRQLEPGQLLLLNPLQAASLSSSGPGVEKARLLILSLSTSYIYRLAGKVQLDFNGELLFRKTIVPGAPRVAQMMEALREELAAEQTGQVVVVEAMISQLSVFLLRHLMDVRRSLTLELSRVGVVDRRLRRAIEYMHLHLAEELSLSQIASAAYLSAYHFARLFKRITGMTPHSYLAGLRLERARLLLATSDLAISQIASQVGYESQSHFAKVFRAATGMTPNQFRQRSN